MPSAYSPAAGLPPIETPCVEVCDIDAASGLCRGCFRSLAEIASWSALSPAERRLVMRELAGRRAAGLNRVDAE